MTLAFTKYEGLGNDFVIVDAPIDIERARQLCDRHRGVGADGVLIVGEGPSMRVINADGSAAEMCGNGLRCVVLHLARGGRLEGDEVVVETEAGPHTCVLHGRGQGLADVEVAMRAASLEPESVPVRSKAPLVDAPVSVAGRTLHVTAVGMGNPHAVLFDKVDQGDRHTLGPALQEDPRFPSGVNVGFARVRGADWQSGFRLDVLERGAGWTQACGTGACAMAFAAVETGRAPRGEALFVELPGGELRITVDAPGAPLRMRGPARHVFDGRIG